MIPKQLYLSFLILLFCLFSQSARANFDFNENCKSAYNLLFEFKFNAAKQKIQLEKQKNPQNGIILLLENYADYLHLLKVESKSEFDRLEKNKNIRLSALQNQDKQSPYYLFTQAEINFQWGILRGRLGSYLTSAREINKAYKLLEQNHKKFPNFHPNLKGIGFINVVLGALPDGFLKSTLSTFGISGDIQKGLSHLSTLADNLPKSSYEQYYEEVVYLYSFLLSDVLMREDAYEKTMYYTSKFSDSSLLKSYLRAYISLKAKRNDQAIQILKNYPKGPAYSTFPAFNYMLGTALLNKLDLSAENYFKAYLNDKRGDNLIKDSYLRLSWIAALKGENQNANQNREWVKQRGYTFHEKDKQALTEAQDEAPHTELLKARLLYDGGYDLKALQILQGIDFSKLNSLVYKTEYYYRFGRIYERLDKDEQAIIAYQKAFNLGKQLKQYYAAKSAVQMGKLHEKNKDWSKAKSAYLAALSLNDHHFKLSIETEAKRSLGKLPKS